MNHKAFYLETCNTCQRILKELDLPDSFEMREIKSSPITENEIEEMKALSGSYESLFSRRAMKYRSMGLNEMELDEGDYKKYILEEYTFLKRPVFIVGDAIFVGNSKKVVAAAKEKINTI